jgi:hypothetical protein
MSKIDIVLCVGVKAPIKTGDYALGGTTVSVSYPPQVSFPGIGPLSLPNGLSTVFKMHWEENKTHTAHQWRVLKAYAFVNELLLAYGLVRIGHLDGCGVRTVGLNDSLFWFVIIDGVVTESVVRLKSMMEKLGDKDDPFDATSAASPHIGKDTLPVARRYVRCHELLEHGFYSEAAIVAFSILDDLVQQMLHKGLIFKGMTAKEDRDFLVRGIKDNRLKTFLGPLLKIVHNVTLKDFWAEGDSALESINNLRNKIAHQGYSATYYDAAKTIYACVKTVHLLHTNGLIDAEINLPLFRQSKLLASQVENPPVWVPKEPAASSQDFQS